jgi:hypothetical protein
MSHALRPMAALFVVVVSCSRVDAEPSARPVAMPLPSLRGAEGSAVQLATAMPPMVRAQVKDPCTLLTTAEVQQAFPGATAGRLDRELEKYGLLRCEWKYPGGRLILIAGADGPDPLMDEAQGMTQTFLDPLRADAGRHVRYEKLSGVGDEAIAVVERVDKAKGFMQDGAILVVQRGTRQVSMLSSDLARRERADALRVLSDLGKAIAKRMS